MSFSMFNIYNAFSSQTHQHFLSQETRQVVQTKLYLIRKKPKDKKGTDLLRLNDDLDHSLTDSLSGSSIDRSFAH